MVKCIHTFNQSNHVNTEIHFDNPARAIEFGVEFTEVGTNFKGWSVKLVDSKDRSKGATLTIVRRA